jgi:hypothetical protein
MALNQQFEMEVDVDDHEYENPMCDAPETELVAYTTMLVDPAEDVPYSLDQD